MTIVIEMEEDNFIVRIWCNRTGKDVDYRIDYVEGEEEHMNLYEDGRCPKCDETWNIDSHAWRCPNCDTKLIERDEE